MGNTEGVVIEEEKQELETGEEQPEESEIQGEEEATPEAAEEEVVVTIGDEEPEEKEEAPDWVKDLRKEHREMKKENKQLKKQLETVNTPVKAKDPGREPDIGDPDIDFDPDKFKTAWRDWNAKKQAYETELEAEESRKKQEEEDWKKTLESHQDKKAELKFPGMDDAESVVADLMSVTQQAMILQGADNSALVIYALGKNPKKAKELASINDPVKFAFTVAKLEEKLKVTQRKPATTPERKVNGAGPPMGSHDKELARLEKEADKTGDRTKVAAYRRKLKEEAGKR
jgi:hypothetical protein